MTDFEKNLYDVWGFFVEDIADLEARKNTAIVLENSAKYMINEGYTTFEEVEELLSEDGEQVPGAAPISNNPNWSGYRGKNGTIGSATRNGVSDYVVPKMMFPIIRRVMPQLIANELVSVQPINGRTGVVFYADYQFTDDKGGVKNGDLFSGNYPIDEEGDYTDVFAKGGQNIPGQAYYSSQLFGPYAVTLGGGTKGESGTAAVAATGTLTTDVVKFLGTGFDAMLEKAELYPVAGGAAITATVGSKDAQVVLANDGSGKTDISIGAATEAADNTGFNGEYQLFIRYTQESSARIPEMQFTIASQDIQTKERKLRIRFTTEAQQDMKAHHQIDLEAELVKMASTEMNYEIDRELLYFIESKVPAALKFSHNWDFNGDNGPVYNYLDRHRALAQSIFALAGKMAQYNRQGAANWAVVSPKVASYLKMMPEFDVNEVSISPNIYTIGSMSKIKYYVDPNRIGGNEDSILLGFKSPVTSYGTGVVYSPYANWMTQNVINPENFDNNKGFFSRYAITLLPRGQWYYAKLQITNLPQLGSGPNKTGFGAASGTGSVNATTVYNTKTAA